MNSRGNPCAACGGTGKDKPSTPPPEVVATKPVEKAQTPTPTPQIPAEVPTPGPTEPTERKRRKSDEVRAEKLEAAKQLLTAEGYTISPPKPKEDAVPASLINYHLRVAVGSLELAAGALEKLEADEKAGLLQSMKQPPMPAITDEQVDALKAMSTLVPGLKPLVMWVLSQKEE